MGPTLPEAQFDAALRVVDSEAETAEEKAEMLIVRMNTDFGIRHQWSPRRLCHSTQQKDESRCSAFRGARLCHLHSVPSVLCSTAYFSRSQQRLQFRVRANDDVCASLSQGSL